MPDSLLFYKIKGSGQPVLYLHGFMESLSMWDFMDVQSLDQTSVLIDLPGHGKSRLKDTQESPSIQHMAQKVIEVADSLGLSSYHVVGHSMGGYVALQLKEMDPRCQKIVLLHSNFWADSEQKKRDRIRLADLAFKAKELLVREAIPGLFYRNKSNDPAVQNLISEANNLSAEAIAYASLAMRARLDKTELLKTYPDAVFVLQGAHDPLIPLELMTEKVKGLPVAYYVLSNTGHMGHIEDPEEVMKLLVQILD